MAQSVLSMVPGSRYVRRASFHVTRARSKSFSASPPNKGFVGHRILLGTHTSGQARDFLHIADLQLPNRDTPVIKQDYDDEKGGLLPSSLFTPPRRFFNLSSTHRDWQSFCRTAAKRFPKHQSCRRSQPRAIYAPESGFDRYQVCIWECTRV